MGSRRRSRPERPPAPREISPWGSTVNSALRISLATLMLIAGPGCSLILTKGPDPELHPPPECTTSVAAPVADTVIAAASLALAVAAAVVAAPGCPPPNQGGSEFCGFNKLAWFPAGAAAATAILFTTSAAVGYQRTSACRASLDPNALPPRGPVAPVTSLHPASPVEACPPVGDAPRVCTKATTWN
jgi:hypothetical protein